MSLNLKRETMISLAETGKRKDLEYVVKNMTPRCDLPIDFYALAITKTRPYDDYEDWGVSQILAKLLFVVVDGKIPIMECLKEKDNNTNLTKWVLNLLDKSFTMDAVSVRQLIEIYSEDECATLFKCAGERLKEYIIGGLCFTIGTSEMATSFIKKYVATSYVDVKELAFWAWTKCAPLSPKMILADFVNSDNNRAREFGIYYLLNYGRDYISFDEFAKIPYLDEEIIKAVGNCTDAKIELLEEWANSNDYLKKLAVAYFAQTHRTPKTKAVVRKLLTDPKTAVRREALVAFARFENVSKRRVLKELYRPKNDAIRIDDHLLIDCFGEKDEVLAYLLSLPRRKYKKIAMAYVNEFEYYGKRTTTVIKDVLYMINDKDIQRRLVVILFDEINNLDDWNLYFEALIPAKITYIECLGNVVAVAEIISGFGCPCLKIIDIIGDFYGEKIAIPENYRYTFPSTFSGVFEIGKKYFIYTNNIIPSKILSNIL